MGIDLAFLAVLVLFGVLGLVSGAIKQLAHLGGLVVGYLAARPLGQLAGPAVAEKFGYPLLLTTIACSFLAFFAAYVVSVLLLRLLLKVLFPDGEQGALNRLGGFAMGAAKAGVIAYVLLSAAIFAEPLAVKIWPPYKKLADSSVVYSLARSHNVFSNLPQLAGLRKLMDAGKDPQAAARLAEDPDFKALSQDPRVRSASQDASVRKAIEEGDAGALLKSAAVTRLLNDPGFVARLARFAEAPAPAEPEATPPSTPRD